MNAVRQISRRFGRSTGALTRSAADYSISAAISVVPDPLEVHSFEAIINKLVKKRLGPGEWFRNLKDEYVKHGVDITPISFANIAPYLFKFCSFGSDENELRRLLPASVREDSACRSIIGQNSGKILLMFSASNDKDSFVKHLKDIGAESEESEFHNMYKKMVEIRDKEDVGRQAIES